MAIVVEQWAFLHVVRPACLSSGGSATGFLDRCADKLGETSARVSMKERRQ